MDLLDCWFDAKLEADRYPEATGVQSRLGDIQEEVEEKLNAIL